MAKPKHRTIAPLLLNGDIRLRNHHRLPESIWLGLRAIARNEHKSMSWVLEEVVIRYFHLRPPKYKPRKSKRRSR